MKKQLISSWYLLIVPLLFLAVRIPSLLSHYVAYTYDQGRDFIAGASIVTTHHIPFIGPTTGINGLFHGPWWYYLLTLPYLIFHGSPIGYYWFNCIVQFMLFIGFLLFIKKEFGAMQSITIGLLIALSPYFIFTSLFVGNNIMVLPALCILLISTYYVIKQSPKPAWYLSILVGFSLGMVGEFELSFGIFLIPLYVIGVVLFRKLRSTFLQRNGALFLMGLTLAMMPRALFELKNGFTQTKILFSFFLHPKLYKAPVPYINRLWERITLFKDYYMGIFPNQFIQYFFLFLFIACVAVLLFNYVQKKKSHVRTALYLNAYLLGGLFLLSTFYKDYFWRNYYEGIQYLFLFIFILLLSGGLASKYGHIIQKILTVLLCILTLSATQQIYQSFTQKTPFDGLQVQEAVVDYIATNQDLTKPYCIRVYTPPVIPYTYNYLFVDRQMNPSSEWVNGNCWFIVEADSFIKRRTDWLTTNMPKDKHTTTIKRINDIEIRHYHVLAQ